MGKATTSRNRELIRGVNAKGRSCRNGTRFAKGRKNFTATKASKVEAAATKQPRFYAADDVKKPLSSRKHKHRQTKLKAGITPGTILIILAGRFKGKRVVFLKQLESGLLLVTGPFKVNGVPLRRVNQVYTITTSTKIDVSKVDVSELNDATFARVHSPSVKDDEGFFAKNNNDKETSADKKALQKKVDAGILASVKAEPMMRQYLNAKFTLTNGQYPHNMKF